MILSPYLLFVNLTCSRSRSCSRVLIFQEPHASLLARKTVVFKWYAVWSRHFVGSTETCKGTSPSRFRVISGFSLKLLL
ncbi:hypothetical protein BDR03DRAFT_594841 [Suillus americanus]|nr:hypothetical protein BDR03DRAFT_594841 [Suillus americanus]